MNNQRVEQAYLHAMRIAREEQLKIVWKILKRYPSITEYCCATGGAFFIDNQDNFIDVEDSRIQAHEDFINEWDDAFHLTGDPIRIKKEVTGDYTTLTDW